MSKRGPERGREGDEMSTDKKQPEARVAEIVPFQLPPGAVIALRPTGEALATMSDDEFERQIAALKKAQERKRRVLQELLHEGIDKDYAVIPGTPKHALLKPGAEKLCQFHSLRPSYRKGIKYGDGKTGPHITVTVKCRLHAGDTKGPVIAEGLAAGSSWERKHRYRKADRVCPVCRQPAIIKGKEEYGGGWLCYKKRGGCGAKWADGAKEIESQKVGEIENTDPYDLLNNILKVTKKRAYIDATVTATATSDLLTQDIDENLSGGGDEPPPPDEPARPAAGNPEAKKARGRKAAAPEPAPEPPARTEPAPETLDQKVARLGIAQGFAREKYADFDDKITDTERGFVFATAKQYGFTTSSSLHPITERLFGVSSVKAIPRTGLDDMIRAITGEPSPEGR